MMRRKMSYVPYAVVGVLLLAVLGAGLRLGLDLTWRSVKKRVRSEFPAVVELSAAELAAWLERGEGPRPLVLDVRTAEEYEVSHLRGAVRIDPGAGAEALPDGIAKDAPIVAYCSVGYRSSALARRLMEAGYTGVRNLEGSIFEWANEGRPVYRGDREVRRVHPYDRRWGRLLDRELHADSAD